MILFTFGQRSKYVQSKFEIESFEQANAAADCEIYRRFQVQSFQKLCSEDRAFRVGVTKFLLRGTTQDYDSV